MMNRPARARPATASTATRSGVKRGARQSRASIAALSSPSGVDATSDAHCVRTAILDMVRRASVTSSSTSGSNAMSLASHQPAVLDMSCLRASHAEWDALGEALGSAGAAVSAVDVVGVAFNVDFAAAALGRAFKRNSSLVALSVDGDNAAGFAGVEMLASRNARRLAEQQLEQQREQQAVAVAVQKQQSEHRLSLIVADEERCRRALVADEARDWTVLAQDICESHASSTTIAAAREQHLWFLTASRALICEATSERLFRMSRARSAFLASLVPEQETVNRTSVATLEDRARQHLRRRGFHSYDSARMAMMSRQKLELAARQDMCEREEQQRSSLADRWLSHALVIQKTFTELIRAPCGYDAVFREGIKERERLHKHRERDWKATSQSRAERRAKEHAKAAHARASDIEKVSSAETVDRSRLVDREARARGAIVALYSASEALSRALEQLTASRRGLRSTLRIPMQFSAPQSYGFAEVLEVARQVRTAPHSRARTHVPLPVLLRGQRLALFPEVDLALGIDANAAATMALPPLEAGSGQPLSENADAEGTKEWFTHTVGEAASRVCAAMDHFVETKASFDRRLQEQGIAHMEAHNRITHEAEYVPLGQLFKTPKASDATIVRDFRESARQLAESLNSPDGSRRLLQQKATMAQVEVRVCATVAQRLPEAATSAQEASSPGVSGPASSTSSSSLASFSLQNGDGSASSPDASFNLESTAVDPAPPSPKSSQPPFDIIADLPQHLALSADVKVTLDNDASTPTHLAWTVSISPRFEPLGLSCANVAAVIRSLHVTVMQDDDDDEANGLGEPPTASWALVNVRGAVTASLWTPDLVFTRVVPSHDLTTFEAVLESDFVAASRPPFVFQCEAAPEPTKLETFAAFDDAALDASTAADASPQPSTGTTIRMSGSKRVGAVFAAVECDPMPGIRFATASTRGDDRHVALELVESTGSTPLCETAGQRLRLELTLRPPGEEDDLTGSTTVRPVAITDFLACIDAGSHADGTLVSTRWKNDEEEVLIDGCVVVARVRPRVPSKHLPPAPYFRRAADLGSVSDGYRCHALCFSFDVQSTSVKVIHVQQLLRAVAFFNAGSVRPGSVQLHAVATFAKTVASLRSTLAIDTPSFAPVLSLPRTTCVIAPSAGEATEEHVPFLHHTGSRTFAAARLVGADGIEETANDDEWLSEATLTIEIIGGCQLGDQLSMVAAPGAPAHAHAERAEQPFMLVEDAAQMEAPIKARNLFRRKSSAAGLTSAAAKAAQQQRRKSVAHDDGSSSAQVTPSPNHIDDASLRAADSPGPNSLRDPHSASTSASVSPQPQSDLAAAHTPAKQWSKQRTSKWSIVATKVRHHELKALSLNATATVTCYNVARRQMSADDHHHETAAAAAETLGVVEYRQAMFARTAHSREALSGLANALARIAENAMILNPASRTQRGGGHSSQQKKHHLRPHRPGLSAEIPDVSFPDHRPRTPNQPAFASFTLTQAMHPGRNSIRLRELVAVLRDATFGSVCLVPQVGTREIRVTLSGRFVDSSIEAFDCSTTTLVCVRPPVLQIPRHLHTVKFVNGGGWKALSPPRFFPGVLDFLRVRKNDTALKEQVFEMVEDKRIDASVLDAPGAVSRITCAIMAGAAAGDHVWLSLGHEEDEAVEADLSVLSSSSIRRDTPKGAKPVVDDGDEYELPVQLSYTVEDRAGLSVEPTADASTVPVDVDLSLDNRGADRKLYDAAVIINAAGGGEALPFAKMRYQLHPQRDASAAAKATADHHHQAPHHDTSPRGVSFDVTPPADTSPLQPTLTIDFEQPVAFTSPTLLMLLSHLSLRFGLIADGSVAPKTVVTTLRLHDGQDVFGCHSVFVSSHDEPSEVIIPVQKIKHRHSLVRMPAVLEPPPATNALDASTRTAGMLSSYHNHHGGGSKRPALSCSVLAPMGSACIHDTDTEFFDGGKLVAKIVQGGARNDRIRLLSPEEQREQYDTADHTDVTNTGVFSASASDRTILEPGDNGKLFVRGQHVATAAAIVDEMGIGYHGLEVTFNEKDDANAQKSIVPISLATYILNCFAFECNVDHAKSGSRMVRFAITDGSNPTEGTTTIEVEVFQPFVYTPRASGPLTHNFGSLPTPIASRIQSFATKDDRWTSGWLSISIQPPDPADEASSSVHGSPSSAVGASSSSGVVDFGDCDLSGCILTFNPTLYPQTSFRVAGDGTMSDNSGAHMGRLSQSPRELKLTLNSNSAIGQRQLDGFFRCISFDNKDAAAAARKEQRFVYVAAFDSSSPGMANVARVPIALRGTSARR